MKKNKSNLKINPKLQQALDNFPKIVKEEERNFRLREKDIARFAKLSKKLARLQAQTTPDEDAFTRAKQTGNQQVTYYNDVGGSEIRTGGNWTWRNQNPGNLGGGPWTRAHGAIGKAGGFAIFPNYEAGRKAIFDLLTGPNYRNLSIWEAIPKYAPAKDNNNVERYRKQVKNFSHLDLQRKINNLNKSELVALVDAIERVEGLFKAGKIIKISPKKKISAVEKDKKGIIINYYVDGLGWLSKSRAISLVTSGKIDAVIAYSRSGTPYLRLRPDTTTENNLENLG